MGICGKYNGSAACSKDMAHNALKNTLKKFTNCLNSRNNV